MIEIELDGKKVEALEGSMIMHAADNAGTYIPHFCYHKKLSIGLGAFSTSTRHIRQLAAILSFL